MKTIRKMKTIICIMALLTVCLFGACGGDEFELKEHLDYNVFTIGEEAITMKEASYYVMDRESNYNKMATEKYPGKPEKYWDEYLLAAGTYFRTWVKEQAYDMCVCDNIYYQEAVANGYELELSEEIEAYQLAEAVYEKMSKKQREQTGLTVDDLFVITKKSALRAVYVNDLLKNKDFSEYQDTPEQALEIDGEYYSELEAKYNVQFNGDFWENLELGTLTIN